MWQDANVIKKWEHNKLLRIENVSLLFASGVAAGAVLDAGGPEAYLICGICAALLFPGASAARKFPRLIPVLFVLCGFFVYVSHTPSNAGGWGVAALIGRAGEGFGAFIDNVPFREKGTGALLKAFLQGNRAGLTKDLTSTFRKAGASHLLALSGLHMGIIYMILDRLAGIAGRSPGMRRLRYAMITAAALFFTLMTGASPSIVRAFLFILIRETAKLLCRPQNLGRTLCTALLLQLAVMPEAIASAGFQLSYLAIAGITLIYPEMEKWYPGYGKQDPLRYLWRTSALSISCQVFTAPLVYCLFGTFPLHFLLTNLIAIPLTTVFMALGITALALTAAGFHPAFLCSACDAVCSALVFSLEVVSSL